MLLAVDSSPVAVEVTAVAGRAAAERALAVRVVHVHEVAATSEDSVELEAPEAAAQVVADRVQRCSRSGWWRPASYGRASAPTPTWRG